MSKNKKNNILKRMTDVLDIDKKKINEEAQESEIEINIIDDCKKFCLEYDSFDFDAISIDKLKDICESGTGLLNTCFIMKQEIEETIRKELQQIVTIANYKLSVKQNEILHKKNKDLSVDMHKTIETIKKMENKTLNNIKEIKHIKKDMKSITTTIISIILAISIIPTAIAGIERINPNYILPFLSSIILFGIVMIIFVYSIYQDKIKKSTWIILIISLVLCIFLWILSFNINIENITNIEESKENKIEQNEIIKDLNDKKENANNKK